MPCAKYLLHVMHELQHSATHYNTLQHTATQCNTLRRGMGFVTEAMQDVYLILLHALYEVPTACNAVNTHYI